MLYTISRRHNVPAKRGAVVRFTDISGKSFVGTVVGVVGSNLKVQFRGLAGTRPIHPKWNLEFLDGGAA